MSGEGVSRPLEAPEGRDALWRVFGHQLSSFQSGPPPERRGGGRRLRTRGLDARTPIQVRQRRAYFL